MTLPYSFLPWQWCLIALAAFLGIISVVTFTQERTRWALILLTFAALVLRLFAITLDPFLNQWDECFHALVAKNMIEHPFTPMLHRVAEMPTTTSWAREHIWLHKPPFFLWQIALSLKLFGLEPWAVRLPSALWWTAMVPLIWRIGSLLVNGRTGFVAAMLCAFAWFPQELIAGAINTDHNDAVFIATVACSWWTLLEFWRERKWPWALALGVFSACAMLTKWYVGLVVFLPWGILVAMDRMRWTALRPLLLALVPVVVLAGSWIGYIAFRFPEQAAFQWSFKSLHFNYPIDGHRGPALYHLNAINTLLPPYTWWIVLPALCWMLWKLRTTEHRMFLFSTVVAIHLFFGIAQTKMICYTMVLFPLYLIALVFAFLSIVDLSTNERLRRWALPPLLTLVAFFMLDLGRTRERHTVQVPYRGDQHWRAQQLRSIEPLQRLAQLIDDPAHAVVFNMPHLHHIQFTFASGIESWSKMPTEADVHRLQRAGYSVWALQDGADTDLFPQGVRLIPDSAVQVPRIARL